MSNDIPNRLNKASRRKHAFFWWFKCDLICQWIQRFYLCDEGNPINPRFRKISAYFYIYLTQIYPQKLWKFRYTSWLNHINSWHSGTVQWNEELLPASQKHKHRKCGVWLPATSVNVRNTSDTKWQWLYINQKYNKRRKEIVIWKGCQHVKKSHHNRPAAQVKIDGQLSVYKFCSFFTMMASSNGNIFRVTVPLCGEFTGLRWIPRTKASDTELWRFLWSAPN